MTDLSKHLSRTHDLASKVAAVFQKRAAVALDHFNERVRAAWKDHLSGMTPRPATPWDVWAGGARYATDFAQRTILFWDALRQRGNDFNERARQRLPPALHFDYETVLDGRTRARRVTVALVRILPPGSGTVDAKRRPYVIIDPRAGHGPGIGGFKDDSQV